MRIMSSIAFIFGLIGCSHPSAVIHGGETDKNHYVIIEDGPADRYWDCYSREDGTWQPTCREVRKERYTGNAEWSDTYRTRQR